MLRRVVWLIARKHRLSALPLLRKHSSPEFVGLYRTWNATANKQLPIRTFSNTSDISTQTKKMDGEGDRQILNVDYEGFIEARNTGALIIDVREYSEIKETGKLPGSIHIPMGNVAKLLETLSDESFKKTFDKRKPEKDTQIILSCRSGMRSGKVQEELQKLGYEKVYNFSGGWLEWESKQKI